MPRMHYWLWIPGNKRYIGGFEAFSRNASSGLWKHIIGRLFPVILAQPVANEDWSKGPWLLILWHFRSEVLIFRRETHAPGYGNSQADELFIS